MYRRGAEGSMKNPKIVPQTNTIHILIYTLAVALILGGLFLVIQDFYTSSKQEETAVEAAEDVQFEGAHVLFISSYSHSFDTVPEQERGILKVFDGLPVTVDEEFMDSLNYPAYGNRKNFYTSLSYKLRSREPYDAVILADDTALLFGLRYRDTLFKGSPLVFMCINDFTRAKSAVHYHDVTGSVEKTDLEGTVQAAIDLLPKAANILAVYDDTEAGLGDYKQFLELQDSFPDFHYDSINTSKYTRTALAEMLEALDAGTILLYFDAFRDADGNVYSIEDTAAFLSEHSTVPVFRCSIGGLGSGLAGGSYFDYEAAGEQAAQTVLEILNGTPASEILIRYDSITSYRFDAQVLKRFHLDSKALPEGTELINQDINYFQKNHAVLVPAALILAGLFLWIFMLLLSNRESNRKAREITLARNKLQYMYDHDTLTKLPNRSCADERMRAMLQDGGAHALLLMDVDDFKTINDTYGHAAGDYVLQEIAHRLHSIAEKYDGFAARYGGDEFSAMFPRLIEGEEDEVFRCLQEEIQQPLIFQGERLLSNISIGITCTSDAGRPLRELFSEADKALQEAKRRGKHMAVFFDARLHSHILEENNIIQKLHEACEQDGFRVLYQPQVSTRTGQVVGYEALLRLKNNAYYPDRFIPVAEKYDLIARIDRIVTEVVISQMVKWRRQGMELHCVSINYSVKQLQDTGYVRFLKKLLQEADLSPELITLEVTESLYMQHTEASRQLFSELQQLGIGIALDDFGTGYSSLNYLTYIPAGCIKLDKQMTDTYLAPGKSNLIKNIVNLAHDLNMTLCIEGVETKEQYALACALGCDKVQGYYFSRPIDGEAVRQLHIAETPENAVERDA